MISTSGQVKLPPPTPHLCITFAQDRVLRQLARDGASNAVIGERLGLTEDTVKSHIKNLLDRAGCKTRTELVVMVLRGRVQVHIGTGRPRKARVTA